MSVLVEERASAQEERAEEPAQTLSIMLFSGTDDRLEAASVLIAGAVAMGRKVNVLLQYWALQAFRKSGVRSQKPEVRMEDREQESGVSSILTPDS